MLPIVDEKDVLCRLKRGDHFALDQLMERYKRPLAARVLRIVKSPTDTEEVLQELFVRVWVNRRKIDSDQPIKPYLFRIAENLVIDMIRKLNREKNYVDFYHAAEEEGYDHVTDVIGRNEDRELLGHLIGRIPTHSRRVFVLCKVEGLSYEEAGNRLGVSVATVNSHMTKARKILKSYLNNHPHLLYR